MSEVTGTVRLPIWNHRMAWIGRDSAAHPVPAPCCVQGCHHQSDQTAQGPSSLDLNTSFSFKPFPLVLSLCSESVPSRTRLLQWGLPRAFSSPDWLSPAPSACLHRRGAAALWAPSRPSSGPTPTSPHSSCAGGPNEGPCSLVGFVFIAEVYKMGCERTDCTCLFTVTFLNFFFFCLWYMEERWRKFCCLPHFLLVMSSRDYNWWALKCLSDIWNLFNYNWTWLPYIFLIDVLLSRLEGLLWSSARYFCIKPTALTGSQWRNVYYLW